MAENKETNKCPHLGAKIPVRQISESGYVLPNVSVGRCNIDGQVCAVPREDCALRKEEASRA